MRDLSLLEGKLALHVGGPVVVTYGTSGSRRPATGIIVSGKVYVSKDGLLAYIPMKSHQSFDFVARRSRPMEGGIPIESILRHMPDSVLHRMIRVGDFEASSLRKEMEKDLACGPGALVDVSVQDDYGHISWEKRRGDPLWEAAQVKSVEVFEAVLKAEIAMLTEILRKSP